MGSCAVKVLIFLTSFSVSLLVLLHARSDVTEVLHARSDVTEVQHPGPPPVVPTSRRDSPEEIGARDSLDPEQAGVVLASRDETRRAFFLIESSGSGEVRTRQLCAVESVARLHPEADVYLLLLLSEGTNSGDLGGAQRALRNVSRQHRNVRVLSSSLEDMLENTPLQQWAAKGKLQASKFQVVHTSDVLRLATLWKYGGVYLDLDVVLTRRIELLNFVVRSHAPNTISNGVLGFERQHPFLLKTLKHVEKNFRGGPGSFIANGPQAVTAALVRFCSGTAVRDMTAERCAGIQVLPPESFYAINYPRWREFFAERGQKSVLKRVAASLGVHLWNRLSSKTPVRLGSLQPYGLLAQINCPASYWSSGSTF